MSAPNQNLEQFAEAMRNVRMAYDKYFMGIERLEPHPLRDAAKKLLHRLLGETQRTTAQKFRLQALQASWLTWEAYWNRIARQIEEGTFKRDKQKAALKQAGTAQSPQPVLVPLTPATPMRSVATPQTIAASNPTDAVADATIRQLHSAFEQARAQLGLPPGGTSLASLGATVNRQVAAIKAQYGCNTVEFKVAIKDGKPILKATPR